VGWCWEKEKESLMDLWCVLGDIDEGRIEEKRSGPRDAQIVLLG
jgi:hypothetical protein